MMTTKQGLVDESQPVQPETKDDKEEAVSLDTDIFSSAFHAAPPESSEQEHAVATVPMELEEHVKEISAAPVHDTSVNEKDVSAVADDSYGKCR
jgi:hypothetical protein